MLGQVMCGMWRKPKTILVKDYGVVLWLLWLLVVIILVGALAVVYLTFKRKAGVATCC